MTAIVVWIGLNGWDVNKSLRQVGIGETEAPPVKEQDEEADDIDLPEEPATQEEEPPKAEEKLMMKKNHTQMRKRRRIPLLQNQLK